MFLWMETLSIKIDFPLKINLQEKIDCEIALHCLVPHSKS